MARNTRHVASGIAAVTDSAYVASHQDVWVDAEDVPKAVREARKLVGGTYRPEVYTHPKGREGDAVCLRL